jgi:2-keto-4-pentenoate hydratase/2-oxohepta-3-ene-1,7-dioic acid hydratase in catechol pathway
MSEIYGLGTFSKAGSKAGDTRWPGVVRGGQVIALAQLLPDAPADLLALLQDWSRWDDRIAAAAAATDNAGWQPEADFTAHLPFLPDNLYGAGANYRRHVIELIVDSGAGGVEHLSRDERRAHGEKEMDERAASGKPYVFVAPRSSVAGPDANFVVPHDVTKPDWEFELALVIGKPARRVAPGHGLDHVAAYTMANDVTSRELVTRTDLKNLGMDWMACKASPGYKIIGPYLTPARFVPDPQKLHIRLSLNGQVMQDEGTDDMIFGAGRIVEFVSAHVRLMPGDIIMTGSPSGNGTHYGRFLHGGDEMRGEIDGLIGFQIVRCVAEAVA